jgi:hypothetical protein
MRTDSFEIVQQLTMDYNFFVIDKNGFVAHFASNRAILPSFLNQPFDEYKLYLVSEEITKLPNISPEYLLSLFAQSIKFDKEIYFKNYINRGASYSKKGLYSYDYNTENSTITDYNIENNLVISEYNLITSPFNRLHFDNLPLNLKKGIEKNFYDGYFSGSEKVVFK